MNRKREVIVTVTYNELGIILDAKAEPRKTGRWIYNSPLTMRCDQCGYVVKDWEWSKANYCAGCGSPMRKDGESIDS